MITITINNNKGKLQGPNGVLRKIQEQFRVKNPNAFYLRQYMQPGWDGYFNVITDAGYFQVGHFQNIIKYIKEQGWKFKVEDDRIQREVPWEIPSTVGELELRGYQEDVVKAVLGNEVEGIPFQRGLVKAATNAGKTLIMASLYKSLLLNCIVVINSSELYRQGVIDDFPKLVGKDLGYMQGSSYKPGKFMVCMAKTLYNRLSDNPKLAQELIRDYPVIIVDECDLADNKTYKTILSKFYQSYIRIGLSGSVLVSTAAKYKIKNLTMVGYFGSVLYDIDNQTLVKLGHSSEVKVRILKGNKINHFSDVDTAIKRGLVRNKARNTEMVKRVRYHLSMGQTEFLFVCRYRQHVKVVYNRLKKEFPGLSIEWAHGDRKERKEIISKFKEGKVNLLVASHIIGRGMNFPNLQVMFNMGGGDSPENAYQLIGRATRKNEVDTHKYYYDFYDLGDYINRHSKHRITYYKSAGFKVLKMFKEVTI